MIASDTNLIATLLVNGPLTREARAVYEKDPEWAAPLLWRSEFRNVLILSLRRGLLSLADAFELVEEAEQLMRGREHAIASSGILQLAADFACSAYDCEFVALARELGVPLVTTDRTLIEKFKPAVVSMKTLCS